MLRRGTHETEDLYQTVSVDMSFDIKMTQPDESNQKNNSNQVLGPNPKMEIVLEKFESLGSDFETPAKFLEDKKSGKISAFGEHHDISNKKNLEKAKKRSLGSNLAFQKSATQGDQKMADIIKQSQAKKRRSVNMAGYSQDSKSKHLNPTKKNNLFDVSEKSKEMTSSKQSHNNFIEKNKKEVTRLSDITKSARHLERSKALEAIRKRTQSMTHINKNWKQRHRMGSLNMRHTFQAPKLNKSNSKATPKRQEGIIMANYSRGYSNSSNPDPLSKLGMKESLKIGTEKQSTKRSFDLRPTNRSRESNQASNGRGSAEMILPRMKRFDERKRSGNGLDGLLGKPSGHSSQRESVNRLNSYNNSNGYNRGMKSGSRMSPKHGSQGQMLGFNPQVSIHKESMATTSKDRRASKSMRPEPGSVSSLVLQKRNLGGSLDRINSDNNEKHVLLKASTTPVLVESEAGSPLWSPDNQSPPADQKQINIHDVTFLSFYFSKK